MHCATTSADPVSRSSPLTRLAGRTEIDAMVAEMAAALSETHPRGVLLVSVLKGSICFLADLARAMTVPVEIDFLAVSSYAPDSGRVRLLKDLDRDITGRDVVLVEDIVDTGLTMAFLRSELERRSPGSLEVAALVDKPVRRLVPVALDYRGMEVPDVFVLGYGLDFAGRYRNLHGLWGADAAALAVEPDLHVLALYGQDLG